ncbi:ceramide kinase isoform X2 [Ischnura elegans]|uniref:ceramide kinase isoform X2 n=1 Tax=Ischnura elegans TaxID=197161 RepID=UPI001ED8B22E|nr:ceramide kinase isoform X2 [Ischnura elegans]
MEEQQGCESVLLNTFLVRKKRCRVYFHRGTLIWETEMSPYTRCTVSMKDVISVHACPRVCQQDEEAWSAEERVGCGAFANRSSKEIEVAAAVAERSRRERLKNAAAVGGPQPGFVIHYAERGTKNRWRHKSVTLRHTDPHQVASWLKTLRNHLAGMTWRPRRLLVVVNPVGGRRKGVKVLEQHLQPMLTLADIGATVLVTQRPGHARDLILNGTSWPVPGPGPGREQPDAPASPPLSHEGPDATAAPERDFLEGVDGVVCVGGDGTVAEVFNALVLAAARSAGVDPSDPEVSLPSPQLRLGVVPAGSTDTVAYCLHGTRDITTAILHIILGDELGMDLCGIHSNGALLRYCASIISYGYMGDIIRESEKFRWMGPRRYDYSGFKKLMANKGYEGEITLLTDSSNADSGPKCLENCERCQKGCDISKDKQSQQTGEWKTVKGKFFMVNGTNLSCACRRCPNGISPFCHIGDGCVDIVLIKHTSLFNNLRLLLRLTSPVKTVFDLPFVEVHRAKEFFFRPLPATASRSETNPPQHIPGISVWNCDGEVIWDPNIRIRVHRQLIKMFARGMEEPMEVPFCSF